LEGLVIKKINSNFFKILFSTFTVVSFSIRLSAMQNNNTTSKGVVSLKLLAAQKIIKDSIAFDAAPQELKEYVNFIHKRFDWYRACPDDRYEYILFEAIKADFIELIPDLIILGADIFKEVPCFSHLTSCNAIEYADVQDKIQCAELLRQIAYKNGHPFIEKCTSSTILARA
jgi:hypothetical protein